MVGQAVALGKQMHLDREMVRRVFQAQIEANRIAQRLLLADWKSKPPFKRLPDLRKVIRPEMDRLTLEILKGMSAKGHWTSNDFLAGPRDPHYTRAWQVATQPFRPLLKSGR